jgi:Cu(I)/Ag(I) efflux system membrane fusion protein
MRIFVISFATIALSLTACNDSAHDKMGETAADHEQTTETAIEHAKKHLDSKYVCPMHPEVVSDEPGRCPTCGMFLVKKEVKPEAEAPENAPDNGNSEAGE